MNVLVTGGAGYIGLHLVQALREAGHMVRILDVCYSSSEYPASFDFDFLQGNLMNANLVDRAVQDMDVVYHLAWNFLTGHFYPEYHPKEERREIQENLFGTLNLLEAALAKRVRHFLFAGSAVVYGPTGSVQVDEEYPCHPQRTAISGSVYGITKLASEKICLLYQQRGLQVTVFRLHGVFSEGDLNQFGEMIKRALEGEPVKATRGAGGEYIHIDDVLRAFILAAENPRVYGEFLNLAGTYTYSDIELARYIVQMARTGSRIEFVEDPMQAMVSVSIDRLRTLLGYKPDRREFLTGLIKNTIKEDNRRE